MVEIIDTGNDSVVGFRVHDTLDATDIHHISSVLDTALARNEEVGLVADLTHFGDITMKGLVADIDESIGRIPQLHRFTRLAVMGDSDWIEPVAKAQNTLIPGVQVRAFPSDERVQATNWVAEA